MDNLELHQRFAALEKANAELRDEITVGAVRDVPTIVVEAET